MKAAKRKGPIQGRTHSLPAKSPSGRKQRVLLAVTGMTPAILTETVWALAQEQPPVIPDRVVVITTTTGAQRLEEELFSEVDSSGQGIWQLLRQHILGPEGQDSPLLTLEAVRQITVPDPRKGRSRALEDFRTSEENAATADYLLEQVRGLVENPDIELITSIAGGRKTLGALLYASMSLLGRETDRLTHVLVNEPYDHPALTPRFFFPQQPQQKLTTQDGTIVIAKKAHIDLGDIPFVPLRNLFERDILNKPSSFTGLVNRCRKKVNEAASRSVTLVLRTDRREIEVNGVPIKLSCTQHVILHFLADPATRQTQFHKFDNALEPLKEFSERLYDQRNPNDFSDWRHEARLPRDFSGENLRKVLNQLRSKLKSSGPDASYLVAALPSKGQFYLDLPPTAVTVR